MTIQKNYIVCKTQQDFTYLYQRLDKVTEDWAAKDFKYEFTQLTNLPAIVDNIKGGSLITVASRERSKGNNGSSKAFWQAIYKQIIFDLSTGKRELSFSEYKFVGLSSEEVTTTKTEAEVQELMEQWTQDPVWKLEETEGFEDYRDRLLAFRQEKEQQWEQKRLRKDAEYASQLDVPLGIALHYRELTKRAERNLKNAKKLLIYYFSLCYREASDRELDGDCKSEIEQIIDNIVCSVKDLSEAKTSIENNQMTQIAALAVSPASMITNLDELFQYKEQFASDRKKQFEQELAAKIQEIKAELTQKANDILVKFYSEYPQLRFLNFNIQVNVEHEILE